MKYQISAGGIVIGKRQRTKYLLLLKDKKREWTFPKGIVKKNEEMLKGARREVREEVGLKHLRLIKQLKPINYLYKWENKLVKKTVNYFLFSNGINEKLKAQRKEGIMQVKWFTWREGLEIIGYKKTNLKLLKQVGKFS